MRLYIYIHWTPMHDTVRLGAHSIASSGDRRILTVIWPKSDRNPVSVGVWLDRGRIPTGSRLDSDWIASGILVIHDRQWCGHRRPRFNQIPIELWLEFGRNRVGQRVQSDRGWISIKSRSNSRRITVASGPPLVAMISPNYDWILIRILPIP